jgi:hypothetical protein
MYPACIPHGSSHVSLMYLACNPRASLLAGVPVLKQLQGRAKEMKSKTSGSFIAKSAKRTNFSCCTERVELALFFSFGISPWDPLPWIM